MGQKIKLRMLVETIFEVDTDWYDDPSINEILRIEKGNLFGEDMSFIDILQSEEVETEYTLEAL